MIQNLRNVTDEDFSVFHVLFLNLTVSLPPNIRFSPVARIFEQSRTKFFSGLCHRHLDKRITERRV